MKWSRFLVLSAFVVPLVAGCAKEEPNESPVRKISVPNGRQQVQSRHQNAGGGTP